jgi:hypothetical protein
MEQHKEEKRHFIKRFFRGATIFVKWLFVVLLIVLLGGGIYYHVPWKVLTLLAIILTAITILPKRYRKKSLAVAGCIFLVLVIWVFLPEDNSDWKPYSLVIDEEIAALDAKRVIPDEENAAVIYNQLFENYDPNFYPGFLTNELENMTASEAWSSKDHPELAEWVDGFKEPFELLMQVSEKDQYVFPVLDLMSEDGMDRLNLFKRWAQMLVKAINNDLGDNNIDGALDKSSILMKMAHHQYQQPTLIDLLVGISIEAMANKQLNMTTTGYELSDMQLEQIDSLLTIIEHDWQSDFKNLLPYELLFAKKYICGTVYEINSKGKTRYCRDPRALYRKILEGLGHKMPEPTYWHRRWFKLGAINNWFCIPSSPETAINIFNEINKGRLDKAKSNFDWSKERPERTIFKRTLNFRSFVKMLSNMSVGPDKKIHNLYLRVESSQQVGRLIVGLRRYKDEHGEWPGSLEEIKGSVADELYVDPVNNGEYGYELTEDGFAIYTMGLNGIDEGGVIGRENEDGSETDDFTFWPGKRI